MTLTTVLFMFCAACSDQPGSGEGDGGGGKADDADTGTSARFKPVAPWSGRLVLPDSSERDARDGVWIEIENAPSAHASFVGKTMWLTWRDTPANTDRLARTVIDINFDARAQESIAKGNIHPTRLNGWKKVGPLESLAGAHPSDDIRVALDEPTVAEGARPTLRIDSEPTIIEGRDTALVTILGEAGDGRGLRVRHYDRESGTFSGPEEIMIFPRATSNDPQRAPMTSVKDIHRSTLNGAGWYVHGEHDGDGVFHVAALEPRALFQLAPDRTATGRADSRAYLVVSNFYETQRRKGTFWRALADSSAAAGTSADALVAPWQEGQRLLMFHLFGAVTVQPGESIGPIRPGHFSFGVGEVIRDRFTGELRLEPVYRQVYAHNGQGVLAGSQSWASYMGSLKSGWMFLRPVSDVLVRFDPVTKPYDFGGTRFDALAGFAHELEIMTARYRTGNGTGASIVTPATSCVQDSAHALFVAIAKLDEHVVSNPSVAAWLAANPSHPDAVRFSELRAVADWTAAFLTPTGFVRNDWKSSLDDLATVDACPGHQPGQLACGLTSYNSMFPRHLHDRLLEELFQRKAAAWFLRTNQVGGVIDGFDPLAPTSPTILN